MSCLTKARRMIRFAFGLNCVFCGAMAVLGWRMHPLVGHAFLLCGVFSAALSVAIYGEPPPGSECMEPPQHPYGSGPQVKRG